MLAIAHAGDTAVVLAPTNYILAPSDSNLVGSPRWVYMIFQNSPCSAILPDAPGFMGTTTATRRQDGKVAGPPRVCALLLVGHPIDDLHDHPLAGSVAVEPEELVAFAAVVARGDGETVAVVVRNGDGEVAVAHVGGAVIAARGDAAGVADDVVVYVADSDEASVLKKTRASGTARSVYKVIMATYVAFDLSMYLLSPHAGLQLFLLLTPLL